ncbi:DUF3524 domain-containing protein [Planctomycetota bacterium]|nr:DUF3524 domain-containing protein [Planctomycetota bacterium]
MDKKKVLFLQGYDGESHGAFLRGWMKGSGYEVIGLTLPGYGWKWRMRHSGVSFAKVVREVWGGEVFGHEGDDESQVEVVRFVDGEVVKGELGREDLEAVVGEGCVVGTSMVNMADFLACLPSEWGRVGCAQYFHENQFAYPFRAEHKHVGDVHYGLSQVISAHAVLSRDGKVMFNSEFNRDSLVKGFGELCSKGAKLKYGDWGFMGDEIEKAGIVVGQGTDARLIGEVTRGVRDDEGEGEVHFVWAGRWEHDKRPEMFFDALKVLDEKGLRFKVSVLGESFGKVPGCFGEAKEWLKGRIVKWGYQDEVSDYWRGLGEGDVFVSTADHEFFGVSVVEAGAAGCELVLPRGLAYPEIWGECEHEGVDFYEDEQGLVDVLQRKCEQGSHVSEKVREIAMRYEWENIVQQMDELVGC